MTDSARCWLAGYGSVFVPRPPFEVARRAGDAGVIVAHHGHAGLRSMLVQPNPMVKAPGQGVPTTVALTYLRLAGLVTDALPPYLVNFLKFPCVISDDKIRFALDWAPSMQPEDTLRATVERE